MALTKEQVYDKMEIVGNWKAIQCREATVIKEDSVEISRSWTRHVLNSNTRADKLAEEPQEVQDMADLLWTAEIKQNYLDHLAAQSIDADE